MYRHLLLSHNSTAGTQFTTPMKTMAATKEYDKKHKG